MTSDDKEFKRNLASEEGAIFGYIERLLKRRRLKQKKIDKAEKETR